MKLNFGLNVGRLAALIVLGLMTLQAAQAGPAPILTRIETDAGHGAGKPTSKQIAERSDMWAFLVKNLGIRLPAGFGK